MDLPRQSDTRAGMVQKQSAVREVYPEQVPRMCSSDYLRSTGIITAMPDVLCKKNERKCTRYWITKLFILFFVINTFFFSESMDPNQQYFYFKIEKLN
jgi:hypothetical protein